MFFKNVLFYSLMFFFYYYVLKNL
ncbi:hypothetical protein NC652_015907 [Populus alba x Populus x berolinensis]|nr:hypothetical protein NC652_015907 [Populus alba x Populus x berolinensis]